jgi:Flp pilus assembly CpaF family ATPase
VTSFAVVQNEEQRQRYEAKLKRELGDLVLKHLADARIEDILLNPDSVLWIKRMGEGFALAGEMAPAQAASAMNTIAAWKGTIIMSDRFSRLNFL